MSAANQPYSESQKAMIEKFNAHIREGSSSFAAPTGLAGVKAPKHRRHKFMEHCGDCGMIYSQCQCWDAVNHIN